MKLFVSLFASVFLWNSFSHADSTSCKDIVQSRGNIQVQMLPSTRGDSCFISVHDRRGWQNMIYRDYLFSEDGKLLVFNSFGDGDEGSATAAREFMFFPRRFKYPQFYFNDQARKLEVISVNGDVYYFDYETTHLVSMTAGNIKVSDQVKPSNRGGVEISNYQGLKLEVGFRIGGSPSSNLSNNAAFTDIQGNQCSVKVGEVFKYTQDGDAIFRYSDKTLVDFLSSRCPQIKFSN